MKCVYPACFYKEEDGRYSVEIPDLNLSTFGDDLPDAMAMAQDAAAGRLRLLIEGGDNLPKASAQESVSPDDETGFVSLLCVDLQETDVARKDSRVQKTLTLPTWLNKAAERRNIDLSDTLNEALLERLAQ